MSIAFGVHPLGIGHGYTSLLYLLSLVYWMGLLKNEIGVGSLPESNHLGLFFYGRCVKEK
jgi:hypothetical protein